MNTYKLKQPILKNSCEEIHIYNSDDEDLGYIKRIFNGGTHFLFDLLFDEWFIHLDVYNKSSQLVYEIREKTNFSIKEMFRSKWFYKSQFCEPDVFTGMMFDKTLIKTNPRFLFEFQGESFFISGDIGDKITRIYDKDGQLIATIERINLIPKQVIINIKEDSILNFYLVASFYYLFDLKR
ncbi:TPA: hypothetical protein RMI67_006100 [Bacillus cereus]|nr:hypothetical protein [Bacillus cereus]